MGVYMNIVILLFGRLTLYVLSLLVGGFILINHSTPLGSVVLVFSFYFLRKTFSTVMEILETQDETTS